LYLDLANAWRTLAEQVDAMNLERAIVDPKPEGT
jgi:hypothetical protein